MNATGNNNNNKNNETLISFKLSMQIIMFVFSVVVFLSLITGGTLFGAFGRAINAFILGILGHSSYPFFIAFILISIKLFGGKKGNIKRKGVACGLIMFFSAVLAYHALTSSGAFNNSQSYSQYLVNCFNAGSGGVSNSTGGGLILGIIVYPFMALMGLVGTCIIFGLTFAVTLLLLVNKDKAGNPKQYNYGMGAYPVQGVKEYPSGYFDGQHQQYQMQPHQSQQYQNQPQQKSYTLPDYSEKSNKVLGAEKPGYSTYTLPPETIEENNVEPVSKRLFVGYIDDYSTVRTRKSTKQKSKSYDILYGTPKQADDFSPSSAVSEPVSFTGKLGGTSYVDTFGDDLESKKKFILTPVDNLLRPESDYGLSGQHSGIFPLNLNDINKNKPPRINHVPESKKNGNGMSAQESLFSAKFEDSQKLPGGEKGYLEKSDRNAGKGYFEKPDKNEEQNPHKSIDINLRRTPHSQYEKYANEIPEQLTPNKFADLKKRDVPLEESDSGYNISNLIKKYNSAANEKPFDEDDRPHTGNFRGGESGFTSFNTAYQNTEGNSGIPENDDGTGLPDNAQGGQQKPPQYLQNNEHTRHPEIQIQQPLNVKKPAETRQAEEIKVQTELAVNKDKKPVVMSPYVAPTVTLLKEMFFDPSEVAEDYDEKARVLEEALEQFKVPAKVVSVTPGPAVTRYELQMPPGVPVSKLTSRANDIAMCLASNGDIRIEAPIPGKSLLGIELPNKKRHKVGLREVIDSGEFMGNKSAVSFALGKDIAGKNIIVDFTKIPHLLIAGSTGSGKSVCLNTLIISLMYKSSPEEVRLILIDPKRVEFSAYNGLPHLMLKDVITDSEKAISAFNWAINEMDRRFDLFKVTGAKDITSYNEKIKNTDSVKLPRIMIIVDELAELMMAHKRELEDKIKKISQLSRAAGIHLILATQRPSVDIITGVIKANLSSRVTFKLMTQADSRTVLDASGAEKLLGEGDMIYITTNMPKPVRLQGPFISMSEVEAIVDFIKENNEAYFDEEIADKILNPITETAAEDAENDIEEQDKYFVDALRLAVDSGQISISMVQRKFAVGYSRAGKIIDEMERCNYITPFEGSKPRQVLISREEFERKFGE